MTEHDKLKEDIRSVLEACSYQNPRQYEKVLRVCEAAKSTLPRTKEVERDGWIVARRSTGAICGFHWDKRPVVDDPDWTVLKVRITETVPI